MAQSLNSTVDYTAHATSFAGLSTYGNVMIGNKAFEYYNERNPEDYIQIPWSEVDHVAASVVAKGKMIPRFAIATKENGTFTFSTRDNKATLRAINKYISGDRMLRSLNFADVVKQGAKSLIHRGK